MSWYDASEISRVSRGCRYGGSDCSYCVENNKKVKREVMGVLIEFGVFPEDNYVKAVNALMKIFKKRPPVIK